MRSKQISLATVEQFLGGVFGQDLHAKRVQSLAGATLGAMRTCSLAVSLIGQGLALARGLKTKHAVKQVDRLLSNPGIDVDALLPHWVRPLGPPCGRPASGDHRGDGLDRVRR